jgi:hypothetical protein
VIAVEEQPARAEHGRQLRVQAPQRLLRKPVQRCGGHGGVGLAVEGERGPPAGRAQVSGHERHLVAVRGAAEGERHGIGVDPDDLRLREPFAQPDAERARAAADVKHQRVGASGPRFHRVDQCGEPFLTVGHAGLLLTVPALDPGAGGVGGDRRHGSPSCYCRLSF